MLPDRAFRLAYGMSCGQHLRKRIAFMSARFAKRSRYGTDQLRCAVRSLNINLASPPPSSHLGAVVAIEAS